MNTFDFDHTAHSNPNVALLRKTLETILDNPHEWDQTTWYRAPRDVCGTKACFAGHAAKLAGHEIDLLDNTWTTNYDANGNPRGGYRVSKVASVAQAELGLSSHQASQLFLAHNTIGNIADDVYEFTSGEVDLRRRAYDLEALMLG